MAFDSIKPKSLNKILKIDFANLDSRLDLNLSALNSQAGF